MNAPAAAESRSPVELSSESVKCRSSPWPPPNGRRTKTWTTAPSAMWRLGFSRVATTVAYVATFTATRAARRGWCCGAAGTRSACATCACVISWRRGAGAAKKMQPYLLHLIQTDALTHSHTHTLLLLLLLLHLDSSSSGKPSLPPSHLRRKRQCCTRHGPYAGNARCWNAETTT
jgi:hypothetical protein